ncbi:MAG: hypothetical protein KDA28_04805 [Phycisphaerales bacterium]|nr:hypothetical protein [Phycisphaerales bacterium]
MLAQSDSASLALQGILYVLVLIGVLGGLVLLIVLLRPRKSKSARRPVETPDPWDEAARRMPTPESPPGIDDDLHDTDHLGTDWRDS